MGGPEEAQGPIDETERLALNWVAQLPYDVKAERVNIVSYSTRKATRLGVKGTWHSLFVEDLPEAMPSVSTFPDASEGLG